MNSQSSRGDPPAEYNFQAWPQCREDKLAVDKTISSIGDNLGLSTLKGPGVVLAGGASRPSGLCFQPVRGQPA